MKKFLLMVPFLALAPLAYGQAPTPDQECRLTIGTAPAIRGLRLGRTVQQVAEVFTGNSQDVEFLAQVKSGTGIFGQSNIGIAPSSYPLKAKFTGVNRVDLVFLDEKVYSIYINYKGPYWDNVDQFLAKLSETYDLPAAKAWQSSYSSDRKTLRCNGFEIRAVAGSGETSVQMINPQLQKIVDERQAEAREKARQTFKP
jgi:hypothetical protein